MTLQRRFSSTRFSCRRFLLSWCASFLLFTIFVVGLAGRPATAQDTLIQFASLDSVTADTADAKTRFSLLSIESTYERQGLRGGALCLVGHGPDLRFPRTFCFYFEDGESLQRDNDNGYDAGEVGPLSSSDAETELDNWRGNVDLSSLPDSVVALITSKISEAGDDEVLSVRYVLGSEDYADASVSKLVSLSSDLTPTTNDANFGSFDGIIQAAHTLGAMAPRLRDAQRLPDLIQELDIKGDSLEAKNKRIASLRSASSESETLILGVVPVSIWWIVPGFLGLVFGGGLVHFRKREKHQQESQRARPKAAEKELSRDSAREDSGPGEGSEKDSDNEELREQIDRLEDPIETVTDTGEDLARERKSLANERKALARERKELSTLAERLERVSKIDETLDERLREKENLSGQGTAQLVEDLLDLHETVLHTFGIESVNPEDAEEEVRNLNPAMKKLWEALDGIDRYESKTLSEIVERASEKSSSAIKDIKEIKEWAADILGRRGEQAENPISQFRGQLRKVMEAASNGEEISTLGALREKVMNLRQEADRASSLEQTLNSVREDRDSLKQKLANFEKKVDRLEQKNSDIVECLDLICDKISIDPIDKSTEHWAENFRRRLEKYTENDWQALLGISAALLAFDGAKSATEDNDALLEELDINDLENELRLFSTKLERAGIQEMIPNAFSDGWLHTLFRAKAVIDAYFQDEYPEVKDAIDQAESVMRTLLHRIDGDYHTISLPASLEEHALPGGDPDTDRGSSILDVPGIREEVKKAHEEKGGMVAYDVKIFPHRYKEGDFKQATVYVPSPSWLTS